MTDKELISIVDAKAKKLWNEINTGHEYSIIDSYNQFYGICMEIAEMVQEEPVSEDLEEAADENSYKYFESVRGTAIQAFIDGNNWKQQQMMKNAIECDVRFDGLDLYTTETWGDMDELLHKINAKEGDKVKLIIIKDE